MRNRNGPHPATLAVGDAEAAAAGNEAIEMTGAAAGGRGRTVPAGGACMAPAEGRHIAPCSPYEFYVY